MVLRLLSLETRRKRRKERCSTRRCAADRGRRKRAVVVVENEKKENRGGRWERHRRPLPLIAIAKYRQCLCTNII